MLNATKRGGNVMAKVYKKVVVNGKQFKKWVEECAVFKFDKKGICISKEPNDYRETNYNEDDPKYFDLPFFVNKKGQITCAVGCYDGCCLWRWSDKSNKNFYTECAIGNIEDIKFNKKNQPERIDYGQEKFREFEYEKDTGNLARVVDNYFGREHLFGYSNGTVIHERCIEKDFEKSYGIFWEYDDDGLLIHEKRENENDSKQESYDKNYEKFFEYDENNRIIRESGTAWCESEDSYDDDDNYYGYETIYEYNDKGLLIHEKTIYEAESNEFDSESFYKYDNKGNIISNGCTQYKYDEKNRVIMETDSSYSIQYSYSENGIVTHFVRKNNKNGKVEAEIKRNDRGLPIYIKDGLYERWYEYDAKGNIIHYKTGNRDKEWIRTSSGMISEINDSDGDLYEFDSSGNLIHWHSGNSDEWYEYEFYENGKIKKKICFQGI